MQHESGRRGTRILVGKSEGKRPLGRPNLRWVDIRMYVGEVGWGGVDWIGLAQDRDRRALVSVIMNLRVPQNAGKTMEWLHNWWPLKQCPAP
jgi:hypothetical protein